MTGIAGVDLHWRVIETVEEGLPMRGAARDV